MAVFEYETWSGIKRLVTADKVVFKPGHVVFLTVDDQLVLGERNPNVNHLRQLPETGEANG
jgi:flagellar biogenesis protein FliO